jgi:hypothetical protein
MTSTDIQNLIVSTASAYGVDPRLALQVAIQESGLNESAVSSVGAIGIFQLMPATAAQLGVDPTDPTQNIQGGVQYLAQLIQEFGDTAEALGAYDWGMGNVQNAISAYGSNWLSYAPAETQNYVSSIMAAVGSEYSVSAGTTATSPSSTAAPAPNFAAAGVLESGVVPTSISSLSIGTIAIIVGLGIVAMILFTD